MPGLVQPSSFRLTPQADGFIKFYFLIPLWIDIPIASNILSGWKYLSHGQMIPNGIGMMATTVGLVIGTPLCILASFIPSRIFFRVLPWPPLALLAQLFWSMLMLVFGLGFPVLFALPGAWLAHLLGLRARTFDSRRAMVLWSYAYGQLASTGFALWFLWNYCSEAFQRQVLGSVFSKPAIALPANHFLRCVLLLIMGLSLVIAEYFIVRKCFNRAMHKCEPGLPTGPYQSA